MKRWIILSCTAALGVAIVCQGVKSRRAKSAPAQIMSQEQITKTAVESLKPLMVDSPTIQIKAEPAKIFDTRANVIPAWSVEARDNHNKVRAYATFNAQSGEIVFFGRPTRYVTKADRGLSSDQAVLSAHRWLTCMDKNASMSIWRLKRVSNDKGGVWNVRLESDDRKADVFIHPRTGEVLFISSWHTAGHVSRLV